VDLSEVSLSPAFAFLMGASLLFDGGLQWKVVRYEFYVDADGEVKKNRVDSGVQWSGNPPRATRTSD